MTSVFLLVCSLGSHQLSTGFSPLEVNPKAALGILGTPEGILPLMGDLKSGFDLETL